MYTGRNHEPLASPNISMKFVCFPRLKPSLSGPLRNIGALNDSELIKYISIISKSMAMKSEKRLQKYTFVSKITTG